MLGNILSDLNLDVVAVDIDFGGIKDARRLLFDIGDLEVGYGLECVETGSGSGEVIKGRDWWKGQRYCFFFHRSPCSLSCLAVTVSPVEITTQAESSRSSMETCIYNEM